MMAGYINDGKSYLGDDGNGYLWEDEHPNIRLGTVYRSSDGGDYLCYVSKLNVTKRATERFGETNHEGAWVRSCGVWQPSHYSANLGWPLNNYLQHVAYAPRQPVKAWLWRRWIDLRWWIAQIEHLATE